MTLRASKAAVVENENAAALPSVAFVEDANEVGWVRHVFLFFGVFWCWLGCGLLDKSD